MSEEMIELTTEDTIELELEEVVESEINVEDSEYEAESEETVEAVEVEVLEEIEIEMNEAVGWTGGDNTRHYSLSGRDEANQHPISAITGLESELNKINALKTVVSDKIGVANYYKWNNGAYNEYGYFVSLVPNTSTIKICEGTDIFGVTVDAAGFVGNQDKDVARDNSYALVATTGLVDVRCESTGEFAVNEGDYVISNGHGIAEKTTSGCGYKVIAINNKQGVLYASIALGVQACTTDVINKNLQHLKTRVDNNEIDIAAAMNVANDAYNKSIESNAVSEEAVLKALEALAQANDSVDATDEMNKILESVNNTAVQAKEIAYSAVSEAVRIQKETYDTANDALSNVNALVKDLEPITQWEDPASGNVGAEYLTTYINDGLATKVEVQTVETVTEENKASIEKNAQGIATMVSSVDKYSVGEYSQAYGLTLEQARNILKLGMIYIPTSHGDVATHSEDYEGSPTRHFTNGFYYEWTTLEDGSVAWSEEIGEVWFGTEEPSGDTYTYWYDGDKLYLLNDGEWTEVATLAGNVNNRITSMIRQDVDSVTIEVINARGSGTSLSERLSDTDATISSNAFWKNDDGSQYVATMQQKANGDESSLALVAHRVDTSGETEEDKSVELKGASIVLGQGEEDSYISLDADKIDFKGGTIKFDASNINFDAENYSIDASKISFNGETEFTTQETLEDGTEVTRIHGANIATGTITAQALDVDELSAVTGNLGTVTAGIIESNNYEPERIGMQLDLSTGVWDSPKFKINENGEIISTGGTLGPFEIDGVSLKCESTVNGTPVFTTLSSSVLAVGCAEGTGYGTSITASGISFNGGQANFTCENGTIITGSFKSENLSINGKASINSEGKVNAPLISIGGIEIPQILCGSCWLYKKNSDSTQDIVIYFNQDNPDDKYFGGKPFVFISPMIDNTEPNADAYARVLDNSVKNNKFSVRIDKTVRISWMAIYYP